MSTNKVLLVAMVATSMVFSGVAKADRFRIEIGDRPFFTHGERYWDGDYEMIWVPGHWSEYGHHWVHGHYRRAEIRHRHGVEIIHDGYHRY